MAMYARFGTRVSLVEAQSHLLPLEDEDVSKELERAFRRQGIAMHLGARVESVKNTETGVRVGLLDAAGNVTTLDSNKLLVAIGRTTLLDNIGLSAANIATSRGRVDVDAAMRTSVPGVYAVGDIVASPALAHVAEMEGIVAADHIAGKDPDSVTYKAIPSCTYGMPEVAGPGWRRVDGVHKYGRGGILGLATTLAKRYQSPPTSIIVDSSNPRGMP